MLRPKQLSDKNFIRCKNNHHCQLNNEKLPASQPGPEADQMANNMMEAVNQPAWDSTRYVAWTFANGGHSYFWDKQRNFVKITWGENEGLLNTKTVSGKAWVQGDKAEESQSKRPVQKVGS